MEDKKSTVMDKRGSTSGSRNARVVLDQLSKPSILVQSVTSNQVFSALKGSNDSLSHRPSGIQSARI